MKNIAIIQIWSCSYSLTKISKKPCSCFCIFNLSLFIISIQLFKNLQKICLRSFSRNRRYIYSRPSLSQFSSQEIEISISSSNRICPICISTVNTISIESESLWLVFRRLIYVYYYLWRKLLPQFYLFFDLDRFILHDWNIYN